MKSWYALFTKPQREWQVSEILSEKNIKTYVPTIWVRRRRRTEECPFFPRYIFVYADFDEIGVSEVQWTPGLTSIVSFGGGPAPVPDTIIERLKEQLEQLNSKGVYSPFKKGDKVRIVEGPLQDFEAVFDKHLSSEDRVRVLVDVLGRLTRAEMDFSSIERVG